MWRLNSEELSMRNLLNFFKLMGENDTGAHTSLVARVKKKITKKPAMLKNHNLCLKVLKKE